MSRRETILMSCTVWKWGICRKRGGVGRDVVGIWDIVEKAPIEAGFGGKMRVCGNLGVGEMVPFQRLGGDDPQGL